MFIKKLCILIVLLLPPGIQAQTTPDNEASPPAGSTPIPPAGNTPSNLDTCLCLRDPATDNLIKNCIQQQRKNENQPRLFCFDAEGLMLEQKEGANWEKLPADHIDCTPCDEGKPTGGDGVPRGGDES